jgi:hypothetical protein
MVESVPWEVDLSWSSNYFLLRNPKGHYRVHRSLPLPSVLVQLHPVANFISCFSKIHFPPVYDYVSHVPSSLAVSLTTIWKRFSFPLRVFTYPAHLISLYLINLRIISAGYKLWSSSLCNFLLPPVTFSLLGPYTLLGNLFLTSSEISHLIMGSTSNRYFCDTERAARVPTWLTSMWRCLQTWRTFVTQPWS